MATVAVTACPFPSLTPILGRPTRTGVEQLTAEVHENAMSMPSTRGGAHHGHLWMAQSAATFATTTGGLVVIHPVSPGAQPVHAAGAKGPA